MGRISEIKRPGVMTRTFYKVGQRMFGKVPTPERIMAHRLPLMLGLGGLYGANHSGQHAQYSGFSTVWNGAGIRRLRK